MNRFLIGTAAAVAAAGLAPAFAQVAPAAKDHTRADVQAKVATHFARMDSDRDGFVTMAEIDSRRQATRAERGGKRFDRLDSDKDGSISREEFEARSANRGERAAKGMRMRHRMGGLHGRRFEMADADKDGRVSLQEATRAALRHFDSADSDRDGRVTREERIEMRNRHRAERQRS